MNKKPSPKFVVGIDEVGRGPLAGPVAVGALLATKKILRKFRAIKESKQLSPKQREEWHAQILLSLSDELRFAVSFVSAEIIDKRGIVFAIRLALSRSLKKLNVAPGDCEVLLDGGLYAPEKYIRQQTIIRGDAKKTVIAMASVVAKVVRDRRMVRLHKKYPEYDFAAHKGYGTKVHIRAIRKHGLSAEHRKSFTGDVERVKNNSPRLFFRAEEPARLKATGLAPYHERAKRVPFKRGGLSPRILTKNFARRK